MHAHKCKGCGTVFYHSDEMAGNDEAHKCPNCGASQWEKFQPASAPLPRFNAQPIPFPQPSVLNSIADASMQVATIALMVSCIAICGIQVYRLIKQGGAA